MLPSAGYVVTSLGHTQRPQRVGLGDDRFAAADDVPDDKWLPQMTSSLDPYSCGQDGERRCPGRGHKKAPQKPDFCTGLLAVDHASHRRASFLPQQRSARLILAVANLGKHLR